MIAMIWSDTFLGMLRDNDVRLVSYVPDSVLNGLGTGRGSVLDA